MEMTKQDFEPIPSMMVGPTEIRRDTENCEKCGEYFGTGLCMSEPVCLKCGAPWPRTKERTAAKCHQQWRSCTGRTHLVKSCFDGKVGHHPEGRPQEAMETPLDIFLARFRFLKAAPGEDE